MTEEKQESTDFELMDKADEEQILQELRGVPVEKFIYKNSRGQQELSYAGTKWVVRQMANMGEAIRVDLPKKERCPIDPEYILVDIIGKRVKIDRDANVETILDSNVGSARGWCKQKLRDGRVVADEFFYNKTVSKATRNVLQMLIPPDLKREMISRLEKMQGGQNRPSGPPQGAPPRQGPPAQGPRPPQGAPSQGPRPPQGPPQQQQRPPAPPPPQQHRPPSGGFAGEAPFPASPTQGQVPQRPPAPPQQQRPPLPPPPQQQRPPAPPQRPPAPPPQQQRPPAPPQRPPAPPQQQVPHQTQSRPDQTPRQAAIDVLQQRFMVVLKQAAQTNDHNQAIAHLYALTGYQKITDCPEALIKELGPILHKVAKQEFRLDNGSISDVVTGEIYYPKPVPQYEAPSEPQYEAPPEQPQEPVQQQAEAPMF